MKTFYLTILAVLLCLSSNAQVYQEEFEAYTVETNGSDLGFSGYGSEVSEVRIGTNSSQVLFTSNESGADHALRSPFFSVMENESYTITFDISVTNTVYVVRIRTEDEAGNITTMPVADVELTISNGNSTIGNASRIENVTSNIFGSTTAAFTVPTGGKKAQFQVYQFGSNSISLDNISAHINIPDLVYQEKFESYTSGTTGGAIGFNDFSNGSSQVAAGSNGTQVLLASNFIGGDHFLRSPIFPVEENESYQLTLDISLTNTVYFIRIRTEDDAGNNTLMEETDVVLTTTNGNINPTRAARIENVTPNTFGTSTATFTVPAGATKAQFQIYQFGVNSFMLDNIEVEKVEITPPAFWSSEAEEGILSGDANVGSGCDNASAQAFIRLFNDNQNRITFGNINLAEAGSYELSVDYFYNSGLSYLEFYVNDIFIKESVFLPSPWCFQDVAGTAKIHLPLQKGTNVITIAAVQGKSSPLLDRLELSELPVSDWFAEAESGTLKGNAVVVSTCATASEGAFVKIDRAIGNGLLFDHVNVPVDGYYKIGVAYYGQGQDRSLDILVNDIPVRLSSVESANFCFEGAASYATINAQLQAGKNSIEFRPIGNDINTPLIDWVEVYTFNPPIANVSLTKQRLEPGETIDIIVSTDDIPVQKAETFSLNITGISPSEYSLSKSTITIQAGKTEGVVQFTPSLNSGEKEITLTVSNNSEDVIINTAAVNAQLTNIPQTIYVSSSEGDDGNDGFSSSTPLRSLARVSELGQISGDQILFKAGDVFFGRLVISANGTADTPMLISSYGSGEKPVLDGSVAADNKGSFLETVLIANKSHIEMAGLHIRNPRSATRNGVPDTHGYGIFLLNDGNGIMENLVFRNLTITDVFSVTDINQVLFNDIQVTGIFAETTNSNPGSVKYMKDLLVEDCYFSKIGKIGFWARRRFASTETIDRETIKNRDIVFRNNTVFENGGSGIVLSNAYNALVESNRFEFTGSKLIPDKMIGRGSGAWFFSCTNVIAQHNISRSVRGSGDSYGMHIDYGNKNVLFQYNYSEDSEGGFVEILGDNINSIWRYNISVNDGLRDNKGNTLWISDFAGNQDITSSENYIYNNSVYVGNGYTPDIDINSNDAYIYNNIFKTENNSKIGEFLLLNTNGGPLDISNNLFFGDINDGFIQKDASALEADPKYIEPGKLEADGYQLFKNSPAVKAGEERPHPAFPAAGTGIFSHISEVPTTDFFGNLLVDDLGVPIIPIGAYSGKGFKVDNLEGYAVCDDNSSGVLQWLVINPNPFAVEFNWTHQDAPQSGVIIAAPGNNYFTTVDVAGVDKERILLEWMTEQGEVESKQVKNTDCYTVVAVQEAAGVDQNKLRSNNTSALKILFPNPVNNRGILNLLLSSTNEEEVNIQLVDLSGKVLYSKRRNVIPGDTLIQLDLSKVIIPAQMVLARIQMNNQTLSKKILIVD